MRKPHTVVARNKKEPNKVSFVSHHTLAPGQWLPCDELSLFGRKIPRKLTLSELDDDRS